MHDNNFLLKRAIFIAGVATLAFGTSCALAVPITTPGIRLLTVLGNPPANHIIWSPVDSTKLLVSAGRDDFREAQVYVLDIEDGEKNVVAETSRGILAIRDWSPDGKQVIIAANAGTAGYESGGLWSVSVADHAATYLQNETDMLRWASAPDQVTIERVIRNAAGADLTQLVSKNFSTKAENLIYEAAENQTILGFSWSPDKDQIALAMGEGFADADYNIFVLDIPSGQLIPLTHDGGNTNPVWSPRGTLIAYVKRIDGQEFSSYSIELVNPSGTCRQELYTAHSLYSPTWSPDGKLLAFIRPSGDGIYIADVDYFLKMHDMSNPCN